LFKELLGKISKSLDKARIPYLVIGGQAVLLYGEPRLTQDIDITLGIDTGKLAVFLKVLEDLRVERMTGATDEFIKSTNVLPCIDPATKIRIDFIFSFLPYEREAIQRGRKVKLGDAAVNFVSPEDLIIHKLFAGRPRDIEDAEKVFLKQKKILDKAYILKWLKEFESLPEKTGLLKTFQSFAD
jgi:predicted nucleotidyltransferase